MSYGINVHSSVKAMSTRQLRGYTFHYLDQELIINELLSKGFRDGFCTGCVSIRNDYDIGAYDCPCSFDYMDASCEKWYVIDNYLIYLISVDLMLRQEFGNNPNVCEQDDLV